VDPQITARLEGLLSQPKNSTTSSTIEAEIIALQHSASTNYGNALPPRRNITTKYIKDKTNPMAFSPQANNID
jgi:hypothetical protein